MNSTINKREFLILETAMEHYVKHCNDEYEASKHDGSQAQELYFADMLLKKIKHINGKSTKEDQL